MKPLSTFTTRLGDLKSYSPTILNATEHPSWKAYFEDAFNKPAYHRASPSMSVASRLIPASVFADEKRRQALISILLYLHYTPNMNLILMLVAPTAAPQFLKDQNKHSLHPEWRTATWLVRVSADWDLYYEGATPNSNRALFESVHKAMDRLRQLVPGTGVSMSEADIWEPEHEEAFWGRENYESLVKIKEEVDPSGRMLVYQGVGWEKARMDRWKCYPKK